MKKREKEKKRTIYIGIKPSLPKETFSRTNAPVGSLSLGKLYFLVSNSSNHWPDIFLTFLYQILYLVTIQTHTHSYWTQISFNKPSDLILHHAFCSPFKLASFPSVSLFLYLILPHFLYICPRIFLLIVCYHFLLFYRTDDVYWYFTPWKAVKIIDTSMTPCVSI